MSERNLKIHVFYIDGIILTSNNLVHQSKCLLLCCLDMKDFGEASYFTGIKTTPKKGIYIMHILSRYNMQ